MFCWPGIITLHGKKSKLSRGRASERLPPKGGCPIGMASLTRGWRRSRFHIPLSLVCTQRAHPVQFCRRPKPRKKGGEWKNTALASSFHGVAFHQTPRLNGRRTHRDRRTRRESSANISNIRIYFNALIGHSETKAQGEGIAATPKPNVMGSTPPPVTSGGARWNAEERSSSRFF